MGVEIERKFLIRVGDWSSAPGERIRQAYLCHDARRTVRVRLAGQRAFLTVKGPTLGATRSEFEYEIPLVDAEALLCLCEPGVIDKVRRYVSYAEMTWHVDEFLGENAGLLVAEVELASEDQSIQLPPWVTQEVTSDAKYGNASLAKLPYQRWDPKSDEGIAAA